MNLKQIIDELDLAVITEPKDFSQVEPAAGYTSDLLSCVMSGAKHNAIWITLQAHANIVAVGALLELSAIIISEDAQPDEATVKRANEEGITLLATPLPTFTIVGRLWEMGIRG